jgi:hypothetical protein
MMLARIYDIPIRALEAGGTPGGFPLNPRGIDDRANKLMQYRRVSQGVIAVAAARLIIRRKSFTTGRSTVHRPNRR